jgi:hypothetical protein
MKTKKLSLLILPLLLIFHESNLSFGPQNQFCRSGLNIPLLSNSVVRDSVAVNLGTGCTVLDANMKIVDIQHTWVAQLRMYLQKGSTGSRIINWVGGSGDNFINTILDDSALIPIESGFPPFTGTYRPSSPLVPFNGISTDGYWRYVITDSSGGDTGVLRAWCVILTFQCPSGGIETIEIPNTYRLYQNYPNPFNPVTRIKYGLPVNGNITLTVFNVIGKKIAVLVDGHKQANTYEVEFDGSNIPSGVYFYRIAIHSDKLEVTDYSVTRKMLMIK